MPKNKMFIEETYYVKDVSKIIDRDKSTIFRWEKEGKISSPRRDSRGWRIYSKYDVERMKRLVGELARIYS
jgi:DNA-binding transcriptional MerR regulator